MIGAQFSRLLHRFHGRFASRAFPDRAIKNFAVTAFELQHYGRLAIATAIVGIVLSGGPANAAFQSCAGANLVQSAANSFAAASQTHSPAAFANAIASYGDINSIALFALGPFRSKLPPARREEYFTKVRAFMGRFFADHAERFANASLQIESCNGNEIRSLAGGREIVWRTSGARVGDVEVDGVWLAEELRSKFVSVIHNSQGNIESLFNFLEQSS
jgi:ABC-type transporter MlaC component